MLASNTNKGTPIDRETVDRFIMLARQRRPWNFGEDALGIVENALSTILLKMLLEDNDAQGQGWLPVNSLKRITNCWRRIYHLKRSAGWQASRFSDEVPPDPKDLPELEVLRSLDPVDRCLIRSRIEKMLALRKLLYEQMKQQYEAGEHKSQD